MKLCPYPETIFDPLLCQERPNHFYIAWHEGYEAHKVEYTLVMAKQVKFVLELVQARDECLQLKAEYEKLVRHYKKVREF